jgi:hypothetical protein
MESCKEFSLLSISDFLPSPYLSCNSYRNVTFFICKVSHLLLIVKVAYLFLFYVSDASSARGHGYVKSFISMRPNTSKPKCQRWWYIVTMLLNYTRQLNTDGEWYEASKVEFYFSRHQLRPSAFVCVFSTYLKRFPPQQNGREYIVKERCNRKTSGLATRMTLNTVTKAAPVFVFQDVEP